MDLAQLECSVCLLYVWKPLRLSCIRVPQTRGHEPSFEGPAELISLPFLVFMSIVLSVIWLSLSTQIESQGSKPQVRQPRQGIFFPLEIFRDEFP